MATYYFSYTLGASGNDGLSPATPKKYLSSAANGAANLFASGNTILLASGDIWPWDFDGTNHLNEMNVSFSAHNGQYMGVYESALGLDTPIIDGLYYETTSTGWVDGGSNRWTKDFSTTPGIFGFGNRIWPGMSGPTSSRNRTPLQYMGTSSASVVAEGQYAINGEVVTVWAPSGGVAPPVYYGGLALNARHSQGTTGTGGTNLRLVNAIGESLVDGLVLRGNQSGFALLTAARDITISDVTVESISAYGFLLTQTDPTVARNIRLTRPRVDTYTSLTEGLATVGTNDGIAAYTSTATTSARDIEVVDPYLRGLRHSGLNFQVTGASGLDLIRGILVRTTQAGQSIVDSRETNYCHAIDMVANGWEVQGVTVIDSAAGSQLGGAGTLKGCVFQGSRAPSSLAGSGNAGGVNAVRTYHYPTLVSTTFLNITGNVFENIWNFSIAVNDSAGTPMDGTTDQIIIENNTFLDQTYYSVGRTLMNQNFPPNTWTFSGVGSSATVVVAPYVAATAYFPVMRNNIFILPAGATGVYGRASSSSNMVTYAVNTGPGTGNGYVVPTSDAQYSSLAEAGLSATYRPSSSSSGYRAGTHYNYASDPTGMLRWNPPTIGAYEVAP